MRGTSEGNKVEEDKSNERKQYLFRLRQRSSDDFQYPAKTSWFLPLSCFLFEIESNWIFTDQTSLLSILK